MSTIEQALIAAYISSASNNEEEENNNNNRRTAPLRIFRRGPNQNVILGPDAEVVARDYLRTTSSLKKVSSGTRQIVTVTINDALYRDIVVETLSQALLPGVEVFEKSGDGAWTATSRGTPGNTQAFDNLFFSTSTATMALVTFAPTTNTNVVGISCCYVSTSLRTIGTCSFLDSPSNFQNLKSFIVASGAKECVVPVGTSEAIESVLSRNGVTVHCSAAGGGGGSQQSQGTPKQSKQRQWDAHGAAVSVRKLARSEMSITRLVYPASPDSDAATLGGGALETLQAVGGVVDHLGLMAEESNWGAYRFTTVLLDTTMKVDGAAVRALHLLPSASSSSSGGMNANANAKTVYDVLNGNCCTAMGSRLLRFYLAQPLASDVDEIMRRQNMVSVFVEDAILREGIRAEVLSRAPDMDKLIKRLQRRKGSTLRDAVSLAGFLARINTLRDFLMRYDGEQKELVECDLVLPIKDMCHHFENLRTLIDHVVEIEADTNEPRVRPEFDDSLLQLDSQREAIASNAQLEFKHILSNHKWTEKQLKMEVNASTGYYFRVSRKEDKEARTNTKVFSIQQTTKDGVKFVSAKLAELNTQYRATQQAYLARQRELQDKLIETMGTYCPVLDDICDIISQLDVFASWALIVTRSRHPFCRPTIITGDERRVLRATSLHHLLLHDSPQSVPNDVDFSSDTTMALITGPNMGGKSTYMRSVGILTILAQIGCYVPAEKAELTLVDSVLCRVGAGDVMAFGASTFMREMQETAHVISSATKRSFIIIDELGRGTSTYDGFGLAWAVAEHIDKNIGAFTLFATHFHELTALAERSTTVVNIHVTAECTGGGSGDNDAGFDSLTFPFKLQRGPCLRSFGIQVAAMAHFPPEALESARNKAHELEFLTTRQQADQLQDQDFDSIPIELLRKYTEQIAAGSIDKDKLRQLVEQDSQQHPGLKTLFIS
eukprot:PhM_4_TR3440/c0_g1_i1/m.24719/K08735/MSH2; DNA mismatch repair protein MSH2